MCLRVCVLASVCVCGVCGVCVYVCGVWCVCVCGVRACVRACVRARSTHCTCTNQRGRKFLVFNELTKGWVYVVLTATDRETQMYDRVARNIGQYSWSTAGTQPGEEHRDKCHL